MHFFHEPEVNETVPSVSPEDLQALWNFVREFAPKAKAFGTYLLKAVCAPGANVDAIMWRFQHLQMVMMMGDEFAHYIHDGQRDGKLIELFATFPFRVTKKDPDGKFELNWEEFEPELRKLQ